MSEHFSVKRITSELRDQHKNPSSNFYAEPLENDLFDWHFTIRGPKDSVYSEGIYHGRLILPLNYPLKPPKFLMFNHSGRFEVGREICMSNTSFHPDEWQPAWTIRTILEGLISFFPEETEGAIGALKASDETRKALALNSWAWTCPTCGNLTEIWKNHLKKFPELDQKLPLDKKIEEIEGREEKKEEKKEENEEGKEQQREEGDQRVGGEAREEAKEDLSKPRLPSEDEVRKFVGYCNSRVSIVEFFILVLVTLMMVSNFVPEISSYLN